MFVIYYKLNYNIFRNISQDILFCLYSLTSYQMKLEPKILEKICAAVPVRAIMISKTQKKFYNQKMYFLVISKYCVLTWIVGKEMH